MALKRYRLYFNRAEDAPQIWSFDEGSHASEVNIQGFVIAAPATSHSNLDAEGQEPKAWIEVDAELVFADGIAFFSAGGSK